MSDKKHIELLVNQEEDTYNSSEDEDYIPSEAELIASKKEIEDDIEIGDKEVDEKSLSKADGEPVNDADISDLWNEFKSGALEKKPEPSASRDASITKTATDNNPKRKLEHVPNTTKQNGLGNLVGILGKKKRLSILDQSSNDWNDYVQEEGIEEELNEHGRSKDSYLDKQDFLHRADFNQFEKEKELRQITRRANK